MSMSFMPWRLTVLLACIAPLAGCMMGIAFDPVYTPDAAPKAVSGYAADAGHPIFPRPGRSPGGRLSVALQKGEIFTGGWQPVSPTAAPAGEAAASSDASRAMKVAAASPAAALDLAADWDRVYGPGYFQAHVLGSRLRSRALLTSTAGATAVVEVYTSQRQCGDTSGVARDSLGYVYKVTVFRPCASPVLEAGLPGLPDGLTNQDDGSPRLVIPATGGPPVMAIPLGGGLYQPVTGDAPGPGTPIP
jgi:hypothetical protein